MQVDRERLGSWVRAVISLHGFKESYPQSSLMQYVAMDHAMQMSNRASVALDGKH